MTDGHTLTARITGYIFVVRVCCQLLQKHAVWVFYFVSLFLSMYTHKPEKYNLWQKYLAKKKKMRCYSLEIKPEAKL